MRAVIGIILLCAFAFAVMMLFDFMMRGIH